MYHYDPATGGIPPGFPSAINLSVKCVAAAQAQAQAQVQMKSSEPTSPGGSVMDLSTSSVTSTSPQVRTHFGMRVQIYAFGTIMSMWGTRRKYKL